MQDDSKASTIRRQDMSNEALEALEAWVKCTALTPNSTEIYREFGRHIETIRKALQPKAVDVECDPKQFSTECDGWMMVARANGTVEHVKTADTLRKEAQGHLQPAKEGYKLVPIAWRCKDYADGWILFHDEAKAIDCQKETGCLMQPLYTAAPEGE